jgi:hypothetical protein
MQDTVPPPEPPHAAFTSIPLTPKADISPDSHCLPNTIYTTTHLHEILIAAKLTKLGSMGIFKAFRSKKKDKGKYSDNEQFERGRNLPPYQTPPASDLTKYLPPPLLEKIFGFVCPHTQDETYESCEQSAVEDACMLCDLRDLAHCIAVSRRWRKLASNVM